MDAITIPVEVGADRRLVIDLPPSTPTGPADVVIVPREQAARPTGSAGREMVRARLHAAGFLVTDLHAPDDGVVVTDEDLPRLGRLAAGARSTADLLDDERGRY
ncbi:MAG: hypothetical protein NVSMB65_12220 [Chloroflexota bacterium]